ncbi:FmdB family zinc ribbon protein [Paraburkholderia sp. C35]|uniref:FmdB family zinc ribbon protein n=1 Tax=Paraburkholderia sp. C35 TaxID=2126993 RepID=UPI000D6988FA|nr:FmdB family zinc ribbon protein [Paraburkholderia sp. C35]
MPIYAYRCESCGFAKDVLQKMSDAPLTQCPECGTDAFRKQVTAAGFQLKGSGWYVTDFRGGSSASNKANNSGGASSNGSDATAAKTESKPDTASSDSTASTSTPAAAPAAAPAPASTGSSGS